MKVLRFSVIALTQFPIWSWLSYFTLDLRSRLTPYKESDVLDRKGSGWIYQKTVYGAATSRFLAFAYFCCGKYNDWFVRRLLSHWENDNLSAQLLSRIEIFIS